jgi:hypothetical protein
MSYHDKFGQYSIWTEGQILFCIVQGVIGETVAKHFDKHFCQLADSISTLPWAYCADLSKCDGYTREAANCIKQSHEYGISHGCVIDAYQIISPLLISQSQKFREALGVSSHIKAHIFNDTQGCVTYLNSILQKTNDYI